MIYEAIFQLFKDTTAITDILGAGNNCKVFPMIIPQKIKLPAVAVTQIGNDPADEKNGPATLDVLRYDIDIFFRYEDDATGKTLSDAIRTALDRFSGTKAGFVIDSIQFIDQDDEIEELQQKPIWRNTQEYSIRHKP